MAHISNDPSPADVLAEQVLLVSSIEGLSPAPRSVHGEAIKAVRDIMSHQGGGIPGVRMYQSFPPWQQRCGLRLLEDIWDKNVVPERAMVFFTLIDPLGQGGAIKREAFGGGTWRSTGAKSIGNQVVLGKLYYKRADGSSGGLTAFEFHVAKQQPRVAVCVMHRKDHRRCAQDLWDCVREGFFQGRIQANLPVVPPINQAPSYDAGFMNGPHVDYTNNLASNNGTSYSQPSIHSFGSLGEEFYQLLDSDISSMPEPAGQHFGMPSIPSFWEAAPAPASLDDLTQGLFSENNSIPEFGEQHSHTAETSMLNDFNNTLNGTMFGGEQSHAAEISMLNDFNNNFNGTMTDNEPSPEPFPLWGDCFSPSAHDHAQDGH